MNSFAECGYRPLQKRRYYNQCNLNDYITPNLVYDEEKSEAAQKDLLSNISWANGFVLNGQKIIDRGEIVDEQTYNILESLRKEWEKRSDSVQEKRLTLAGQILYVGIFLFCFMAYLELFRQIIMNEKEHSPCYLR